LISHIKELLNIFGTFSLGKLWVKLYVFLLEGVTCPPVTVTPDFYSKTNEMRQFLKFILFCNSTLHVSDGPSVRHQESKTVRVHTASGICQTDSADCFLAGTRWNTSFISFPLASSQQTWCCMYSWWWTENPSETC